MADSSKQSSDNQINGWVRFKATNFWQTAFVRPFPSGQDKWKTRLVSGLSYVVGIFLLIPLMSAALIDDYMTAAIPLEFMHKTTGVLESVTSCNQCPRFFELRQQSGEGVEFSTAWDNLLKLKTYVGTEITVWSQEGFQLPTQKDMHFFTNRVYEIQIHKSGEFLNNYQVMRSEWGARDHAGHWWHFSFLLVGIWLPFRVWWKYRKAI